MKRIIRRIIQQFSVKKEAYQAARKKFLLIGMPAWGVAFPFHSLAQVGGILNEARWNYTIADLNIKIFRLMSPDDQQYWHKDQGVWTKETFCADLYEKYRDLISDILLQQIQGESFNLIGFSINDYTMHFSLTAAKFFKSIRPDVPILFGGVSCFPNVFGKKLFSLGTNVPDIMLQGEAEIALLEFLNEFSEKGSIETEITGFAYRSGGVIKDTGEPAIPNLKNRKLRSDFSQFDFSLYTQPGDFPVFFSRGCVNRCKFCSESPNYKHYRIRAAEDVITEMLETFAIAKHYKKIPNVSFSDSLINGNMTELDKLCDLIIGSGKRMTWGGQAHFKKEMDRPFLEKMYKAGARSLLWGFETGSQHVNNLMGKRYDLEVAKRIITDTHTLGITSYLPIIVGFPGESPDDFLLTVAFVLRHKKHATFFPPNPMYILPNSYIHEHYRDFRLANNDCQEWHSEDGKNNVFTRQLRVFIIQSVLGSVDSQHLPHVDFNNLAVASETAALVYGMSIICHEEDAVRNIMERWNGKMMLALSSENVKCWHPENIPAAMDLTNWFTRDKDFNRIVRLLSDLFYKMDEELNGTEDGVMQPDVEITGFKNVEGPYTQWNLPRVRWANKEIASVEFTSYVEKSTSPVSLTVSFKPQVRSSAVMSVIFNGTELRTYTLDRGTEMWRDDVMTLLPKEGQNIIEFVFPKQIPIEGSYMLFRKLSLEGIFSFLPISKNIIAFALNR